MKTQSNKKSPSGKSAPTSPTSIEVFANNQKQLEAVGPRHSPTRIDTLVAEGRLLAEVARRYRAKLVAVGVSSALVDSLDERATMVEGAQLAQRQAARGKDADELAITERASAVRGEILRSVRFAMRRDPEVQRRVDAIQDGTGLDDLVADLGACAELCDAYPTQLAGVQVNAAKLAAEARALHTTLSTAVRDRRLRTLTVTQHTNARDRAVAYLLEAMTEVREAGLFAFRDDPKEARSFRSIHVKRSRRAKADVVVAPDGAPESRVG